ncbi:GNAT family N-acetyltransferase [Jeotgalibacillus marinus]|uniref:GNAT family N-acetyltransferase n=1 Tax=Jeotgalibacillus marinus TaxID=86667 RepID=A0ABV3Q5F2_9BACL
MEIRRVQVEDAKQYRAFRLEALKNASQAFGASYEEEMNDSIDKHKSRFSSEDSFTFGAFNQEKLIGVVTLVPNKLIKIQHKANILAMYVTPSQRGEGVGAQLMEKAIEQAKRLPSIEQVLLTVVESNLPAKKLYSSLGFVPFGLEKNAMKVNGEYVDEEYMVLFLGE